MRMLSMILSSGIASFKHVSKYENAQQLNLVCCRILGPLAQADKKLGRKLVKLVPCPLLDSYLVQQRVQQPPQANSDKDNR
jgi:hypothetical protein